MTNKIQKFNVQTRQWSFLSSLELPVEMSECSVVEEDGTVHVIGGYNGEVAFDDHWMINLSAFLEE